MNFRPMQGNIVCHACNKTDHIEKYYRSKNALIDKNKLDENGKEKVEEVRE